MKYEDHIITKRLILRRFRDGDEFDVLELNGDDETARRIGLKPMKSITEAKRFIDIWRYDAFVVTEQQSDRLIGIIQTPCSGYDIIALGYWLKKEFRGQGYMTEAVNAVKEYLFDQIWWCDRIEIFVYVGNDASRNVALKCGFYPSYEDYNDEVYSPYGAVESKERFVITYGDYDWARRGAAIYSTAL